MVKTFLWGRACIVVLVVIALLLLYYGRPDLLRQLEFKLIDAKFRVRGPVKPGDEIAVIAIDSRSIEEMGEWPWSRRTIARLIKTLSDSGARVIGIDILFSSPDREPGADRELVEAIRDAGNVVLGYFFSFSPRESTFRSRAHFERTLRELSRFRVPSVLSKTRGEFKPDFFEAVGADVNAPAINRAVAGSGYYTIYLEKDGSVRRVPLLVQAEGNLYQNFGVAVLKVYFGAENVGLIRAGRDELHLEIGPLKVPVDRLGEIFVNYYGPKETFPSYPAWKVLAGEVPEKALRDRIVLVGGTSPKDFIIMRTTPFYAALPSVELQATCIDNMIHGRAIAGSDESDPMTVASVVTLSVLLGLLLPRSGKLALGLLVAGALAAGFLALNFYLFAARNVQVNAVYPLLAIAAAFTGVAVHTNAIHWRRAARLRSSVGEMGMGISGVLDLDRLLPKILDSMIRVLGASRGMLLTYDSEDTEGKRLRPECRKNMPDTAIEGGDFAYAREIVSRVKATGESVAICNVRRSKDPAVPEGRGDHLPRAIFCAPLRYREALLGVIYIESMDTPGPFWEEESGIVNSFAAQAAIAIENASIYSALSKAEEKLRTENVYLKREIEETKYSPYIVGKSEALMDCLRLVEKAAASDITVLIEGETGVGKKLVARAIHFTGMRRDGLFVTQNCAALPEPLLESELFGHRKGAFTGAFHDKKGLLEIADGGTIFLDEVADMAPGLQARLLRALEDGVIRPVGGVREKKVDLRIISATNRDLAGEVKAGRFREDLYYRLNAFTIRVPPLRERREDIPLLVTHFIERVTERLGKEIGGISREAMARLTAYDYPGNVRELENEIEKAMVMAADGEMITTGDLSNEIMGMIPDKLMKKLPSDHLRLKAAVAVVEKEWIIRALSKHGGNKSKAARELGISRNGLNFMLRRLNLEV